MSGNRVASSTAGLSLSALTIRGSVWVAGGYVLQQLLRLGGNLVLTRLLFPEAFGIMALVAVFVQGLEMFSDLGLRPAVIRSDRGDQLEMLNTAWTLQMIRGFLLWLVACALAWPMAQLYSQPLLVQLLPVAGLTAIMTGLNSPSVLALNRRMMLGKLTTARVVAQAVGLAVMVAWAWRWETVWALVVGGVVNSAVLMVLTHTVLREKPVRPHWDSAAVRELLQFGKWIFIATALTFLAAQGDRLVLGMYVDAAALGIYSIGYMLSDAAGRVVSQVSHSVLMPAFSRVMRENPARLNWAYGRARMVLNAAVLPVAGLLLAAGDHVVVVLYDARYVEAGWVLQVLSLRLVAYCMIPPASVCLMALGKPQYAASAAGAKTIFLFTGIPVGFALGGLQGAVWAVAAAEFAAWPLVMRGMRREGMLNPLIELSMVPWLLLGWGLGWGLVAWTG